MPLDLAHVVPLSTMPPTPKWVKVSSALVCGGSAAAYLVVGLHVSSPAAAGRAFAPGAPAPSPGDWRAVRSVLGWLGSFLVSLAGHSIVLWAGPGVRRAAPPPPLEVGGDGKKAEKKKPSREAAAAQDCALGAVWVQVLALVRLYASGALAALAAAPSRGDRPEPAVCAAAFVTHTLAGLVLYVARGALPKWWRVSNAASMTAVGAALAVHPAVASAYLFPRAALESAAGGRAWANSLRLCGSVLASVGGGWLAVAAGAVGPRLALGASWVLLLLGTATGMSTWSLMPPLVAAVAHAAAVLPSAGVVAAELIWGHACDGKDAAPIPVPPGMQTSPGGQQHVKREHVVRMSLAEARRRAAANAVAEGDKGGGGAASDAAGGAKKEKKSKKKAGKAAPTKQD